MKQQRSPRLVCNPGWQCSLRSGDKELQLAIINVSCSGILLEKPNEELQPLSRFEITISHRSKPVGAGACGSLRGHVRRQEPASHRVGLSFDSELSEQEMEALRQTDHRSYSSDAERWRDDGFLDQLARAGDFLGDAFDERLTEDVIKIMNAALDHAEAHRGLLPEDAPAALRAFLESTSIQPTWVKAERERLNRGRKVLERNVIPIGVVLFLKALPTGYCSPALARALAVSGDLADRPVRRSLLVADMILELCKDGAFAKRGGTAMLAAQRLRLLHAGVRRIIRDADPGYAGAFGAPVNQEHMLATIIAFSHETIEGLRQLHVGLSRRDEEDFMYMWQVFGWMLGLHPEGQSGSTRHVPRTFEEIKAFKEAYRRRHFANAADNPQGVRLAEALLRDVGKRVSFGYKIPLVHRMPRWLCRYLLSGDDQRRLGIPRPRFPVMASFSVACFVLGLAVLRRLLDLLEVGRRVKSRLVIAFLSELVEAEFGENPRVRIPENLRALQDLVTREGERRRTAPSTSDRKSVQG